MYKLRNAEYKNLVLIFLVAFCLRMLLFFAVGPWNNEVEQRLLGFDDSIYYHNSAITLAEDKPIIDAYDRPLFRYFIASVYSLFGYKPYIVFIFQIIMGSFTCVVLYKIGRFIFREKIALIAGLLLAVESLNLLYTNYLLTETMFIFLFTIHSYFLMKFLIEKNNRGLLYSAVFLGLATHVRSVGLYYVVFLVWPFFLYFRSNLRKGLLSFSVLLSVFLIIVVPWMYRNSVVAGEFVLSSDQGKAAFWLLPNIMNIVKPPHTMLHYWTAEEKRMIVEEADQPGMSIADVVRKHRSSGVRASLIVRWRKQLDEGTLKDEKPPVEKYRTHGYSNTLMQDPAIPENRKMVNAVLLDSKRIIKGMCRYPLLLNTSGLPHILGHPVYRTGEYWDKGLWEMAKAAIQKKSGLEWFSIFMTVSMVFYLYVSMCFGIYTAIRKKEFLKIVLFVSIIVYFVVASAGAITAEAINPRLRLPVMPYVIIISCYGLAELLHRFKKTGEEDKIT